MLNKPQTAAGRSGCREKSYVKFEFNLAVLAIAYMQLSIFKWHEQFPRLPVKD